MNLFEQSYSQDKKKPTAFTFSNNLQDIYSLIQEDRDNNWMLRALNRSTFSSPKYRKDIWVQLANYIETNRQKFKRFIVGDFNQYVKRSEIVLVGKEIKSLMYFINYIKQI